jgi:hypothetical protein
VDIYLHTPRFGSTTSVNITGTTAGAATLTISITVPVKMQPQIHLRYTAKVGSQLPLLQAWLQWNGVEISTIHQIL